MEASWEIGDRWIYLKGPESTGGAKPNGFWGSVTMFCHHMWKRVSEGNLEAILGKMEFVVVRRFAASYEQCYFELRWHTEDM